MLKLSIPITLPFGFGGDINNLRETRFNIEINKLRDLSRHKCTLLEYNLDLVNGHQSFIQFGEINHASLKISPQLVQYFTSRHDKSDRHFTLEIALHQDIKAISREYSCPDDIYRDIIFYLSIFIHGNFNIAGFARFSPLIIVDDVEILFNARLAYLLNPWQDWFCSLDILQILLDEKLKRQIDSEVKHYEAILPHVKSAASPLSLNDLSRSCDYPAYSVENILVFGRVLSEIIRLHPSYDYSAIIGLLTALIEGILKIKGENRYKFKIKISNLMKDHSLGQILNKIYDSRSDFFHTAKFHKLNDIFEILTIEFLLVVIRKIINYNASFRIDVDTFDFVSK